MCKSHYSKLQNIFHGLDFSTAIQHDWDDFQTIVAENNKECLKEFYELIDWIINHPNCKGAMNKINSEINASQKFERIDAFLKECKFAKYYLEKGFDVEFITEGDRCFKRETKNQGTAQSPDLKVSNKDEDVYVEVTSYKDLERFLNVARKKFDDCCKKIKEEYELHICFYLSHSDIRQDNRSNLIQYAKKCADEFSQIIDKNNGKMPEVDYFVWDSNKPLCKVNLSQIPKISNNAKKQSYVASYSYSELKIPPNFDIASSSFTPDDFALASEMNLPAASYGVSGEAPACGRLKF
ncbi:MAG: hypothetical protein CVT48_04340 [Thermoplasmata archaeon HGW-Thermoplasmata-1]|nr:MAG: hypothetical protein CVT48_04340 [Thermoplasmata archaeon HGW-Thermoplasmata-1]